MTMETIYSSSHYSSSRTSAVEYYGSRNRRLTGRRRAGKLSSNRGRVLLGYTKTVLCRRPERPHSKRRRGARCSGSSVFPMQTFHESDSAVTASAKGNATKEARQPLRTRPSALEGSVNGTCASLAIGAQLPRPWFFRSCAHNTKSSGIFK